MNADNGEVVHLDSNQKPPSKRFIQTGDLLEVKGFEGARWRVTSMKSGGRLFLKLVR